MTVQAVRIADRQKGIERRNVAIIAALVAACVLVAFAALASGASDMGLLDSAQALFGFGSSQDVMTVRSIRLPRVVCAIVAGAGLALAGAALQSVLENPLASASTVGISQGAAFGATVAILLIIPSFAGSSTNVGMGTIALFAFAGAMASSLIVLLFSRLGFSSPESIILVGVALSALWAGASTIIQYFSDDLELTKVIFWQFGDLGRATWSQIGLMALLGTACAAYFFANRWNYNALQNGGHVAGGLGVDVKRTRVLGVVVASLMAAVMVSFVGLINFIGLIAPHIARRFVGDDYRFLLPASLVLGAIIMLASDLAARMVISPIILPIGAITSFLGAPLFLYLLYRGYKR
ncbi:FecCD family ABC transporter permease [Eggerthella hominis]|uniref:FecCD family ABC transporter permease n=1 Tax=Eggerthella hominis TaxID=2763043 RepID=UPI00344DA0CC